jgi:hypothetical protein
MSVSPPKLVFIVPYRNRPQHKFFFSKYMSFILEDRDDYEIYFSHQCDSRTFNRGATKNIGFLAVKAKYPNDYKDITFVFNDVDTIPFNKIFNYETTTGTVKHFYGFTHALGGLFSIKGSDFEKTNGFPCFWGWGMEDNVLQRRCDAFKLNIDRSVFYKIGSPEMLQLFDGVSRIISKQDSWRIGPDNGIDGLRTIRNLTYTIHEKSENPSDNLFSIHNSRIWFINIRTFDAHTQFETSKLYTYDLREPKDQLNNPNRSNATHTTVPKNESWANIPYYPTLKERRAQTAEQLRKAGKPVPEQLLRKIEQDKIDVEQNDVYNKKVTFQTPIVQPQPQHMQPQHMQPHHMQPPPRPPQHMQQPPRPPPRPLSQQQPKVKPRATASARVGLGGVY